MGAFPKKEDAKKARSKKDCRPTLMLNSGFLINDSWAAVFTAQQAHDTPQHIQKIGLTDEGALIWMAKRQSS